MPKIRKPGPGTASPPSPKGTEGTTAPGGALINLELASVRVVSSQAQASAQQTLTNLGGCHA